MEKYSDGQTINVGFGSDLTIKELAEIVKSVVEFEGELVFNSNKPDGTPKKLMSSERINILGWSAKISLTEGIKRVYSEVDKTDW